MSVPINKNKMDENTSEVSLALHRNLLVCRGGRPIWTPDMTEDALKKAGTSGAAFAPHFFLL